MFGDHLFLCIMLHIEVVVCARICSVTICGTELCRTYKRLHAHVQVRRLYVTLKLGAHTRVQMYT